MKSFYKTFRYFAIFACIIFISLLLVEGLFHYYPSLLNREKKGWFESPMRKVLIEKTQARIYRNWRRNPSDIPNPFFQPWLVYNNSGFENDNRLNEIVAKVKFPANTEWIVPNVFRNPNEKELINYRVKTNSLGFRDAERRLKKQKNTYRIIVLGSYVTFGYGLNEDEIYIRRLEKILNADKLNGKNYEVWNWGRQGSTSIMGYALLVKEVMKYNPDMIIYDYGWADLYTRRDWLGNTSDENKYDNEIFSAKRAKRFLENICYMNALTSKILDSTELCFRALEFFGKTGLKVNISSWRDSLKYATDFIKTKRIPFLMLKLNPQMPAEEYSKFSDTNNHIYFLDAIPHVYSQKISDAEVDRFWAKTNWLSEANISRSEVKDMNPICIRNDAIQYGALGHKFIADRVFKELKGILSAETIGL